MDHFPSDEQPIPDIIAQLQNMLDANAELGNEIKQYEDDDNQIVDLTISCLQQSGVDLDDILELRQEIGEESGIEKTHEMIRTLVNTLQIEERLTSAQSGDDVLARGRDILLAKMNDFDSTIIRLMSLSYDRILHGHDPSSPEFDRKAAEARLTLDDSIEAAEKQKWLKAIDLLYGGEGLDATNPETFSYIENAQLRQNKDYEQSMIARSKRETIRDAFRNLIENELIAHHDDLNTLEIMLVGAVIVGSEPDSIDIAEMHMSAARAYASKMGWSEAFLQQVVDYLKNSLGD